MKFILLLFTLIIFGCSSMSFKKLDSLVETPSIDNEISVGVGSEFFNYEKMTGTHNIDGTIFSGSNSKFDLRVRSVSKDKLVLDYSEYFIPSTGNGSYSKNGGWSIKPGFNKTLEFDLSSSKKITYEIYEFEVTKIETNKVFYKRLK